MERDPKKGGWPSPRVAVRRIGRTQAYLADSAVLRTTRPA
jgi:hypothetical protein